MQISCPNCGNLVEQRRPPSKNDAGAGDAWVCWKCPSIVCVGCYVQHNAKAHGEVYSHKSQPTKGSKKNSKGKKR